MNLVPENDPVLKTPTPIFEFSDQVVNEALIASMFELMTEQHGMGLAAPQVGLSLRLFVMKTTDGDRRVCINPEILSVSEETERDQEGCLSFPGLWLKVNRPLRVDARFSNEQGNLVYETFENLNARCYLHETDHLNGVRFTELVGPLALQQARKRAVKRR